MTTKSSSSGAATKREDTRPREGPRLDALLVAGLIGYGAHYYSEQHPYTSNFSHGEMPFVREYLWSAPTVACVLYLALVHIIAPTVFPRPPKGQPTARSGPFMNFLLRAWNLFLCLLSVCMLIGMGAPLVKLTMKDGIMSVLCDPGLVTWKGSQFFWMYLFNLSKFAELIDTVFLVVRRKPVNLLHWYHHTSVLCYTWFAVYMAFTPGWGFACMNAFVHTIMYWYYYRTACGYKLTYDKLVTTIQLLQMVAGIAIVASWAWVHLNAEDKAVCPQDRADIAIGAGAIMYGSYFLLFLSFYINRYMKSGKTKSQ